MTSKNQITPNDLLKLIYLMPVWMGCGDYLVHALQVNMNKVARLVTKLNIFTPTNVLLHQCGWMSVKQLMAYHSFVLLLKTLKNQTPSNLIQKITSRSEQYNTRQAAAALEAAGVMEQPGVENCELGITSSSWCWSSVRWYNRLPTCLTAENKLGKFKTRLKDWVTMNIELS
jgi:hypothetical protein